MIRLPHLVAISLLSCLTLSPAAAQMTAVIEGFVTDPSGSFVHGATVNLIEQDTSVRRTAATNAAGRYEFSGLPSGRYRIEAVQQGFRTAVRSDMLLDSGRGLRIDFALALGETREQVIVTGDTPLVSLSVADWGKSVAGERLSDLPLNGRDLYDLAAQQPGVSVATTADKQVSSGLGIHVSMNGARPNQNAFRIDGVYINDATGSAPASSSGNLLGLDAISEIRLVTTPFSTQYGRALGGLLTAVSKSGTNQLHGSAYEYLRNSSLDAKNYFDSGDTAIPPLRKNQFGGFLGGPIQRNRIFFLANYEAVRQSLGKTVRANTLSLDARQGKLPGQTVTVAPAVKPYLDLYPLPNGVDFGDGSAEFVNQVARHDHEDFLSGKLDFIPSQRWRVNTRYIFDASKLDQPDDLAAWSLLSNSRNQFAYTELQFVPSASTVHSFRAGFSRIRYTDLAEPLIDAPPSLAFLPGRGLGDIEVTGLSVLGGGDVLTRPKFYVTNEYQLNWSGTHTADRHTLHFGAGYTRQQFNQNSDFIPNGRYRFDSITSLLQGRPRSGDVNTATTDTVRGWRQRQYFGYIEDQIWLSHRLQLLIGVRYETYTTPTEVNGKISTLLDPVHDSEFLVGGPLFRNPSHKDFAPRASLAWDPLGDGRTVLRAGSGIFYDTFGSRELHITEVRLPPFYEHLRPSRPAFPSLLEALQADPPLPSLGLLDYYLNQPYVLQFQASVERQVASNLAFQIAYSGSRGAHLMGRVYSTNPPTPQILPDGRAYFPANTPRINPNFDQIDRQRSEFNSFYHALHLSLTRQLVSGFRIQMKYSWSKSIDEVSTVTSSEFAQSDRFSQILDYRSNRGSSDFDVRHIFALDYSWLLPGPHATGAAQALLGGWELYGLVQAQSGPKFSPTIGFDRARVGTTTTTQRPDLIAAPGAQIILGDPNQWFDPHAFALPEAGFLGNLGRNVLDGPGLFVLNTALHKTLWKSERQTIRLRIEGFNLLNHPNFQVPSSDVFSTDGYLGTAGRIVGTSTSSRQVQLALKWAF